jgi:hypothetical protein
MDRSVRNCEEGRVLTESQITRLLKRLCVDLGFCLPSDVAEKLASSPPRTIDAFVRAVFKSGRVRSRARGSKTLRSGTKVVALAFDDTL